MMTQDILKDKWPEYVECYEVADYQRKEVEKAIDCHSDKCACFAYYCEKCDEYSVQKLGCNSRICSKCGKRYTDGWSVSLSKAMFKVPHRHFVISVPIKLWPFLDDWDHKRIYMNAAIETLDDVFSRKLRRKIKVGVIVFLHSFGKDLGKQPHLHLLVTEGGFDEKKMFVKCNFLPSNIFRKKWQYYVLKLFQENGLSNSIATEMYRNYPLGFYVWLHKRGRITNPKLIMKYIGRYVRHPAIANSRITKYDGEIVKFYYEKLSGNGRDKEKVYVKIDVMDFIGALIQHIPPKNFKTIRYYGAYARRSKKIFGLSVNRSSMTQKILKDFEGNVLRPCPKCTYPLVFIGFYPKGPPDIIKDQIRLKKWLEVY